MASRQERDTSCCERYRSSVYIVGFDSDEAVAMTGREPSEAVLRAVSG
jgi:hypothetical protein